MGTEETLGRGSVQFMTAGTGIRHSEHNRHPRNPLRFIQVGFSLLEFQREREREREREESKKEEQGRWRDVCH